ncbi:MAG: radical SAM protein [Kiritimatiellae bacterium]|nr:radical SAM protein [Kiritimatiellia bacterium]
MGAEADRCSLCPRRCGAARFGGGERGFCGAGEAVRLFRWGPHFGEEPPITGERGSGCIFFSRCTMKCVYCQNSPWSWRGQGQDKTVGELASIMRSLALEDRVENWNLVSPTPYLRQVREAAAMLAAEGVRLPFVWNSSGYERVEVLEEFRGLCDVALFDLRYSREETAQRLSSAFGYVAAARRAVLWAAQNTSLVCRVLVLPGLADEAIENLAWLAAEVSTDVHVSLMAQYTPAYLAKSMPPLDRTVTREEYESVAEAAADFGFENGWIQGYEAADPALALLGENMPPDRGAVR